MPRISAGSSWNWEILHDPLSQGMSEQWYRTPRAEGWKPIRVPSAWQATLGPDANGIAWYRCTLPCQAADVRARTGLRLKFESVATDCRAWVNGIEVGRHVGDFLPFEFDITDAVKASVQRAVLLVRVDQMHAPRPGKGVVTENGHITKGFHDVLSLQHAGLWGEVSLRTVGTASIKPLGVHVHADPGSGAVAVRVEFDDHPEGMRAECAVIDPAGNRLPGAALDVTRRIGTTQFQIHNPALWSPESPNVWRLLVVLRDVGVREEFQVPFAFRSIITGGPGNSQILLNGVPLQIRGLLHWGHEPGHIAPMPPPEQVREEFKQARARGFNCMCLCMFYPPDYYFDIADETGMLIWQEHPVWKSRMTPADIPDYKRLYTEFFKRDRQHPSVIVVSGTCEHDSYDAELGRWWWKTGCEMVRGKLKQIQTGFLEWTPPEQTDLYDDHVYDNCGRWVKFHDDMQVRISTLPPKPFIMGETIISNAWPDPAAVRQAAGAWWATRGAAECEEYERDICRRVDDDTRTRFLRQGTQFACALRKFQGEVLRMYPRNAGFVTNSIRDVPICRIGLMDDFDRWRFAPEDLLPWINDVVLLLKTPGHQRAFDAGAGIECQIGVSNFSPEVFKSSLELKVGENTRTLACDVPRGTVQWQPLRLELPAAAAGPESLRITARASAYTNQWTIWAVHQGGLDPSAHRADVPPYSEQERAPTFEERGYSSGWGLPCSTWAPVRQWAADVPLETPSDRGLVLTHRLTARIAAQLHEGGRVILFAGPHKGGIGSTWINLWGLLPLIVEQPATSPFQPGEGQAVMDLLLNDLTCNTTRALPSDELHLTDHLEPIVRYVYTHDSGVPKTFDACASARVGSGLLVITTLDHTLPAGRWLLNRLAEWAMRRELRAPERELDIRPFLAD